jgi:Dyp-type peroxidase family
MLPTNIPLLELPEQGINVLEPGIHGPLLADLQGNIIKSHGRDFSVLLFLRWRIDQLAAARQWLASFASHWITSALQQFEESRRYREFGEPGSVFGSFFLSRIGYEVLGFRGAAIPSDQPFRMGMRHDELARSLGDPPVSAWEQGYQEPCHALLELADDDLVRLLQTANLICQDLRGCAEILHREDGFTLRNEKGQTIEHFGYRDGISQPLFASSDIQKLREAGVSFDRWDPRAPLSLVLVRDPNGRHEHSFGSYLVLRKLEQNVRRFNADVRQLADTLAIPPDQAGALAVGRFKDGTPVTGSAEAGRPGENDFDYSDDAVGSRCPFHAHVRKSNPRGESARVMGLSVDEERNHRIVRRAMSYGTNQPGDEPETGSGLLFLCYQANIENQFNFIQSRWVNAANFLEVGTGPDPLVGQPAGTQQWPLRWGERQKRSYGFNLWVALKGGDYFFAPSISSLLALAP